MYAIFDLTPEKRFQILVDGVVDYALFLLDPGGHIASWNSGAERIKGYRADEVVGKHFSMFYSPEDRQRQVPQNALKTASKRESTRPKAGGCARTAPSSGRVS